MHLISRIIWVSLVLPGINAWAGNEVGNGGNAVVCPNKVELLDLFEARILRKQAIDPSIEGKDPFAIAKARITLLSKIDPRSAQLFQVNLDRIQKEASFEEEILLRPVDDSKHAVEPADPKCKVEQLAVFRKKTLPGEKLLLINQRLWKRMLPVQQASLLLHESIYWHLSKLGEADSTNARYLVSFLVSPAFVPSDSEAYWKLIKSLRIPIYH